MKKYRSGVPSILEGRYPIAVFVLFFDLTAS